MKYRRNKVKREHGIIRNALLWLENLGRLSEVTDIIPGVIDVSHSSERGIVFKYETQTGCKLLLKSNGSIQEVFVVTKDPACVQEWVKKEFPPDSLPSVSQIISESNQQSLSRKKLSHVPLKSKHGSKNTTSTPGHHHSKRRSYGKVHKPILGDQNAPNVADRLDLATLKALNHLKQSLENVKIQDAQAKLRNSVQK
ncbi:MAG: DUF2103 domain-containing protein [Desulfosporosinus sp.]